MTETLWTGVLGTHGSRTAYPDQWVHPESPFSRYLKTQGFSPARPGRPFRGSTTDLDGVPVFADGNDWEAGAYAWIDYLQAVGLVDEYLNPLEYFVAFVHSHGGQLALIAAAEGLKIPALVMVGTPVRKEIEETVAPKAVANIGVCLHLCDARWDFIGLAGAVLDWRFSLRRTFRVKGIDSQKVNGVGHSGLYVTPEDFEKWPPFLDRVRAPLLATESI